MSVDLSPEIESSTKANMVIWSSSFSSSSSTGVIIVVAGLLLDVGVDNVDFQITMSGRSFLSLSGRELMMLSGSAGADPVSIELTMMLVPAARRV